VLLLGDATHVVQKVFEYQAKDQAKVRTCQPAQTEEQPCKKRARPEALSQRRENANHNESSFRLAERDPNTGMTWLEIERRWKKCGGCNGMQSRDMGMAHSADIGNIFGSVICILTGNTGDKTISCCPACPFLSPLLLFLGQGQAGTAALHFGACSSRGSGQDWSPGFLCQASFLCRRLWDQRLE
jgi:hypothetical protein